MTVTTPAAALRLLLSTQAAQRWGDAMAQAVNRPISFVHPGDDAAAVDADMAFVSRDVTGLSTKHSLAPGTRRFYDALLGAPSLQWVHVHSAGIDRPVYQQLMARGVAVSNSSGTNAEVVAQTALAGVLALARQLPRLMAAQREARWTPVMAGPLPRDLAGQQATVVGWGPVGQHIARLLQAVGLRVAVVRQRAEPVGPGLHTVTVADLPGLLPSTDWLVLACPLTTQTERLVDARLLAALPPTAHLINVARGEIVDEPALVRALQHGQLAGAYLDVFEHEPLAADSPLWRMQQVIATPHCAGFSDGNAERVAERFLSHLRHWCATGHLPGTAG